jgi:hypothetical protein
VFGLDPETGSELWVEPHLSNYVRGVSEGDGAVFGATNGKLVAFDPVSGSEVWSRSLDTGTDTSSLGYDSGDVLLGEGERLEWRSHRDQTLDPSVSIDGTEAISVNGSLGVGETVSEPVDLSETGGSLEASTSDGTDVSVALSWVETTESIDPEVSVNGYTVGVNGTLSDGETVNKSVDRSHLSDGENTVSVSVSEGVDGPTGTVGLRYSHEVEEKRSINYSASSWSESYAVSKVWSGPVDNASLTIPWGSDRVVEVSELDVSVGGTALDPSSGAVSTDLSNGELTISIEEPVESGEEISVEAVGSKVAVESGSIRVIDGTELGEPLDSEIEVIESVSGEPVEISVDGAPNGELLHYSVNESWDGEEIATVRSATGEQTLRGAAPTGGTFTVRTAPVEVEPNTGAVEVELLEISEPSDLDRSVEIPSIDVSAASGSPDSATVTYYSSETGETWGLIDTSDGSRIDRAEANSPVTFTAPINTSMSFELLSVAPSLGDGVAAGGSGSSGLNLSATAVILGSVLGLLVIFGVIRRFGIEGRYEQLGIAGAVFVVGVVAVEAVTYGSVIALTVESILSPFAAPGAGTIVIGLGLLLGLAVLRATVGLPLWVLGLSVGAVSLWVLDSVADGAITEGLTEGLSQVSPLIWIALIGGSIYLIYTRLKPRDIVIRGDGES